MNRLAEKALVASLLTVLAASSDAALLSRMGGQAVYDTDLDITWQADASYPGTYNIGLGLDWSGSQAVIAGMNTANYLGVNNWRLPATGGPYCAGYSCNASEMGHLFYDELGGSPNVDINSTHNGNYDLFSNIKSGYWSGTDFPTDSSYAWYFGFGNGYQSNSDKRGGEYTWAVRDGDIQPVPVPAAAGLFGSALGLLFGAKRRKRSAR